MCIPSRPSILIQSLPHSFAHLSHTDLVELPEHQMTHLDEALSRTSRPTQDFKNVEGLLIIALQGLRIVALGVGLCLRTICQYSEQDRSPLMSLLLLCLSEVLADELHKHKVVLMNISEDALQMPLDFAVIVLEGSH